MPSIIEGYNYDVFISYRQKDNRGERWVSEFVESLKTELESTFKEEVNVYFDINPHDGLLETHDVDASLSEKLKCLVFIPIISRTYCDPKSFAWEHEFRTFLERASNDRFGLKIKVSNSNVTSRVLPIQIHEITSDDKLCIEKELGGILRPVEFIYKEPGVNRPLRSNEDHPDNNLNKTFYRNQINKVANTIDEIISSLKDVQTVHLSQKMKEPESLKADKKETVKSSQDEPVKFSKPGIVIGISILAVVIVTSVLVVIKSGGRNGINDMIVPVTVVNENGDEEVRMVFKEDYITKLSIFPFANETNDSSVNWLQYGLLGAIYQDLSQFNYLTIRGNLDATHLQQQINDARTNNFPYFISGAYRIVAGIYEITSRLYQTSNGSVIKERIFKGNDFFQIIDSISLHTRIDLKISENLLNSSPDLPIKEQSTYNLDAFRYYITGAYIGSRQVNLYRSVKLDSTFALALCNRAIYNHWNSDCHESALKDIDQAMRHRQRLSEFDNIYTRMYYYTIHGEIDKAIRLLEMQYDLQPKNTSLLLELVYTYDENLMLAKFENAAQLLNKLILDHPDYQIMLARCYLLNGKYDKGLDLVENVLKNAPEKIDAFLIKGQLLLQKKEFDNARMCYEKAILLQPENEKYWSKILDHISYLQNNTAVKESYESFTGVYSFEDGEMTMTSFILNNHIVFKAKNQAAAINYAISDTHFTTFDGINDLTFVKNDQGKIIKAFYHREEMLNGILWKEDSLICKAFNLLNQNAKADALPAFIEAYAHNPDHYYLANFIQHLELVQSHEYERIKPVLETYTGKYGNMMIFKKNDQLYYEDFRGFIYKLLPMSESQFMTPGFYNRTLMIVRKNNYITGLEIKYHDGRKEFLKRND